MAFVYSVLSEDEKKELLDKYKFNNYFRRNKPDRPYHWEIPIIFAFIWNEEICKIEIYYEIKKVNEKMFCYLEISRVVAPEFFRDKEKELTFWLKEALKKEERFLMWDCEIVFPETFPVQFTDKKGWSYE